MAKQPPPPRPEPEPEALVLAASADGSSDGSSDGSGTGHLHKRKSQPQLPRDDRGWQVAPAPDGRGAPAAAHALDKLSADAVAFDGQGMVGVGDESIANAFHVSVDIAGKPGAFGKRSMIGTRIFCHSNLMRLT